MSNVNPVLFWKHLWSSAFLFFSPHSSPGWVQQDFCSTAIVLSLILLLPFCPHHTHSEFPTSQCVLLKCTFKSGHSLDQDFLLCPTVLYAVVLSGAPCPEPLGLHNLPSYSLCWGASFSESFYVILCIIQDFIMFHLLRPCRPLHLRECSLIDLLVDLSSSPEYQVHAAGPLPLLLITPL